MAASGRGSGSDGGGPVRRGSGVRGYRYSDRDRALSVAFGFVFAGVVYLAVSRGMLGGVAVALAFFWVGLRILRNGHGLRAAGRGLWWVRGHLGRGKAGLDGRAVNPDLSRGGSAGVDDAEGSRLTWRYLGSPGVLAPMVWGNPWPTLLPAACVTFTVLIAAELVLALVKGAASADAGGGDV